MVFNGIPTHFIPLKEYFEMFEDKDINKKHKGIKKGLSVLGFENFFQRIKSLDNFDSFQKKPCRFKRDL